MLRRATFVVSLFGPFHTQPNCFLVCFQLVQTLQFQVQDALVNFSMSTKMKVSTILYDSQIPLTASPFLLNEKEAGQNMILGEPQHYIGSFGNDTMILQNVPSFKDNAATKNAACVEHDKDSRNSSFQIFVPVFILANEFFQALSIVLVLFSPPPP